MKNEELLSEDETYKYIIKQLKERFHRRLGYECEKIEIQNIELVPLAKLHKFMDISYTVDGLLKQNIELQSKPVYPPKMEDMYKYRILSQADEFCPFKTCVFATYPPTQGIQDLEIDGDLNFHPDFYFTKNQYASKVIKTASYKNSHNIQLTDNEAIDLLIAPDMVHDYDIKELLKITSELLINSKVSDKLFHCKLINCQRKILKRFLYRKDRKEIEIMINLKAEDYGFEPNVTGFEESNILAYQDGKREGKKLNNEEIAKKLIKEGLDNDFITKITGLNQKTIQKLRKLKDNHEK